MFHSRLSAVALAGLVYSTTAIDLGLDLNIGNAKDVKQPFPPTPPYETTTITIPYVGTCTTSTTITACTSVTVVVQTPLATPTCGSSVTTSPAVPTPSLDGPCPLIKPRCRASGLNVAYYSNPFAGYSRGILPWSYYVTQNLKPLKSSLTNRTFFPQNPGPDPSFPRVFPDPEFPQGYYARGWTRDTDGGIVVDANNFTMVYDGFYRAPTTGKYTLCTTADNENDVFFGHSNAFDCYTGKADPRARPLIVSTGGNFINGINCTDVQLIGGAYYPIRNVMGNWQGPSAFNFTIQKPGEAFEDRKDVFTGDVYPRSCALFA